MHKEGSMAVRGSESGGLSQCWVFHARTTGGTNGPGGLRVV